MRRIFTFAALLLCINSVSFVQAQDTNGLLNAYETKTDQMENRIDEALCVAQALEAELNTSANPQAVNHLEEDLNQAINCLDAPLQGMIHKASEIGEPGLSKETDRLAVFPSLLQSGSTSSARTASDASETRTQLEEMARITGDDIRREVQEARINN